MSGWKMSQPVRWEEECGEVRSADLEALDGGKFLHFSGPYHAPIPSPDQLASRFYKDRQCDKDSATSQCYHPFGDYFGINTFRTELSPAESQSSDDQDSPSSVFNISVSPSSLSLDQERLASAAEFSLNGTTSELDEYDVIQQKLRGQDPPTREIPGVPNDRIKEYLWHKQCRTSVMSMNVKFQDPAKKKAKMLCVFCKNNKEPQHVYTSHVLKDSLGRTACHILRKYTCPICGATGDHAHTIKYCPLHDNDSEFRTTPSPLRTSRNATGKIRKP